MNRLLSEKEKTVFAKVSRFMCMTMLMAFATFLTIGSLRYVILIVMGLFLAAILQILGKLKQA